MLRDLIPFVQFKKYEKHPWRNVTFNKVAGFLASNFTRSNTPPWEFFTFLNGANGTKSCNISHLRFKNSSGSVYIGP